MAKLNLFCKSQFHKKIFLLLLCIISVEFIYFFKHYIVNTILQTSPVNDVEDDNFMMLTLSNTSGGLVNISLDSVPKESTTSPFTQASRLPPNHGRRLVRSTWLPIRGPGDSDMPFEDEFEPTVEEFPKDLFKEKPIGVDPKDPYNPPLKKILFWNDFFNVKHFEFGFGQEPFLRAGCRVNTCMTTGDRTRFPPEELDAVIWHPRASDRSLPSMRSPHTHYVFWMMESASYLYGDIKKYDKVFNWTFTYRLDSDFLNLYGMVYRRRDPLPAMDIQNIASTKTKLVAWFVSNCQTAEGREQYVNSLKTWIEVDIYGKCGQLQCSRNVQFTHCYKMLETDYKFYLSFENSLCQDYVTEKFFNILRLNVVPVVYGLANYSVQAPPRSYINALDFSTPKDLADYLLYLDKNDTAYNEYFLWKSYHFIQNEWANVAKPYCDMCERLHENHTVHAYDVDKWFREESRCRRSL